MDPPKIDQCPSHSASGMGVFSRECIKADQWIGEFWGELWTTPTRLSVQFGPEEHIEPSHDCILRYLNHACAPNAAFRDRMLYARQVIETGEEITVDYNCTEYDLSASFECCYGAVDCVGQVVGYRHLTQEQRDARRSLVADWLRDSER